MRNFKLISLAAAAALLFGSAQAVEVTGAGATFPAPIYAKWADAYQKATGNKINYQSIGSGGGIKQITAKTVDFGASDMPRKPEDLEKDGQMQFPAVIGGEVLVFNLPGIQSGKIKLTGSLLADIYLGKIVKWNDKALVDLNPGVPLPDQAIAVVRRADGSGTTFIFTNYLSKVSDEWKTKVGEGTAVQWPVGLGGKGNEGVSAFVQRIPGSIGYVEYAYAKQNHLKFTRMINRDGKAVAPTADTFRAATANADWAAASKQDFYVLLVDEPGAASWPITATTYILMYKRPVDSRASAEVLKFFKWAYAHGGGMALGSRHRAGGFAARPRARPRRGAMAGAAKRASPAAARRWCCRGDPARRADRDPRAPVGGIGGGHLGAADRLADGRRATPGHRRRPGGGGAGAAGRAGAVLSAAVGALPRRRRPGRLRGARRRSCDPARSAVRSGVARTARRHPACPGPHRASRRLGPDLARSRNAAGLAPSAEGRGRMADPRSDRGGGGSLIPGRCGARCPAARRNPRSRDGS